MCLLVIIASPLQHFSCSCTAAESSQCCITAVPANTPHHDGPHQIHYFLQLFSTTFTHAQGYLSCPSVSEVHLLITPNQRYLKSLSIIFTRGKNQPALATNSVKYLCQTFQFIVLYSIYTI